MARPPGSCREWDRSGENSRLISLYGGRNGRAPKGGSSRSSPPPNVEEHSGPLWVFSKTDVALRRVPERQRLHCGLCCGPAPCV